MKPWDQTGSNEKQIIPATKTIYKHFWCVLKEASADHLHMQQVPIAEVSNNPSHACCGLCPASGRNPPSTSQAEFRTVYATLSYTKLCAIPEQRQGEAQIRISSGNHLINTLLLNKSKERRDEPRPGGGQRCC